MKYTLILAIFTAAATAFPAAGPSKDSPAASVAIADTIAEGEGHKHSARSPVPDGDDGDYGAYDAYGSYADYGSYDASKRSVDPAVNEILRLIYAKDQNSNANDAGNGNNIKKRDNNELANQFDAIVAQIRGLMLGTADVQKRDSDQTGNIVLAIFGAIRDAIIG